MKHFALYIAGRYIKAKKSQNAINIMSVIAAAGVFVGAAALVIVLSVFNGFETLVTSLYNSFDADYVITPIKGKTFIPTAAQLNYLKSQKEFSLVSEVLQENVLLKNGDKQYFATIKGVSPELANNSRIKNLVVNGELKLESGGIPYASLGQGVAIGLSLSSNNSIYPLTVYVPNKESKIDLVNTANAFRILNINVSSVFSVQQDVDSKYFLVPLSFTRELLSAPSEVTSIELYSKNETTDLKLQKSIQAFMGSNFVVKNKEQQHDLLFKIMKSEKWAVFFILVFILIVASFNVIGSLTMLIIDKRKDIAILKTMGATLQTVKKIFLWQGVLISLYGALGGISVGLFVCYLQQQFGFIGLGSTGSFVVDAYPIKIVAKDILAVFITVMTIGIAAALIATKSISKIDEEGLAAVIKQE